MLRSGVRTVLIIDHRKALAVACNTCISILNLQSVAHYARGMFAHVMPFTHLLAHTLLIKHSSSAQPGHRASAVQSWPHFAFAGDCGKGLRLSDCWHWQTEVSGSIRHHCGSVHVDHQEKDPASFLEKAIFLFVDKTVPQSRWGVFTGIGHLLGCLQDSKLWSLKTFRDPD